MYSGSESNERLEISMFDWTDKNIEQADCLQIINPSNPILFDRTNRPCQHFTFLVFATHVGFLLVNLDISEDLGDWVMKSLDTFIKKKNKKRFQFF